MSKKLPIDFNHQSPPLSVTDPEGAAKMDAGIPLDREFPRDLKKWAGKDRPNDTYRVNNQTECDAAVADGWSLTPVLVAPGKVPSRAA